MATKKRAPTVPHSSPASVLSQSAAPDLPTNITYVNPDDILIESNIRHHMKPFRLERLMDEIQADGKVHTPIVVEELPTDHESGKKYRLITGHYRTAGVTKLNAKGAGMSLPAIVESFSSDKERLRRQISENNERESLSAIDMGIAIKKLVDNGYTKIDIRKIFAKPGGKKFGMQLASNGYLNMMLSFLDFPKMVQDRIDDGRITVRGAYDLRKKDPDKWQAIVKKIEADRLAEAEEEDKAEAKLLADEAKEAKKAEEAEKAAAEAAKVQAEADEAERLKATRRDEEKAAHAARQVLVDARAEPKARKAAEEAFKAAAANARAAEKIAEEKARAAAKAAGKAKANEERMAASKARLEAARVAAKAARDAKLAAAPPISNPEIGKASNALGATPTPTLVKLNATQMREVADTLSKPSGYEKVQAIGKALLDCFNSVLTPGQLTIALAKITGEYKPPKTK